MQIFSSVAFQSIMLFMALSAAQTARGYEEPFSVQFSVFLANRVGQLKEILNLFAEKGLEVLGVSVVDSTDWAVIRLVFSDPNKAREMLKANALPFTESQVLLIELPDPDSLSDICGLLLRAEINVHFAYPLIVRRDGNAVMVFHVDDTMVATHMLTSHGVKILGSEDLTGPT
jgi:hypothetical protein